MSSTGSMAEFDFAAQQKAFGSLINAAFLTDHTKTLLSAQADFLLGLENAITGWLNRRHEAINDAQRLVSKLHETQDPSEIWRAQQDWMSNELRRLAADAADCQSAATQMFAGVGRRIEDAAHAVAEAGAEERREAVKPDRPKAAGSRVSQDSTH